MRGETTGTRGTHISRIYFHVFLGTIYFMTMAGIPNVLVGHFMISGGAERRSF